MRKLLVVICVVAATHAARAEGLAAAAQAAISHYRAEHGLPAVTPDARLMALAAEQAHAMAKAGVLEHNVDRPFEARIVRYDPSVAVENIAAGTTSFAATLELWKHSPGHDANLRRDGVTRFGIASAAAPDSKYKIFWSLIMAGTRPRHELRQASGPAPGPGLMSAAPGQATQPVVRVRAVRSHGNGPDLVSSIKSLLRPLLPNGPSKDK
jgi:cysteine-rich secretory family protein